MTRSDRLKAALCVLVDERREEIDALRSLRTTAITVVFDEAGLVDYVQIGYESPRERMRATKQRCVA